MEYVNTGKNKDKIEKSYIITCKISKFQYKLLYLE